MDAFFPESSHRLPAILCLLCAATLAGPVLAATDPRVPALPVADRTQPIAVEAAYSELDRRNDRLVFRNLRVTQGALSITADEASASPADFMNSVWTFVGSVVIRSAETEARADRAELTFRDNELRRATLIGEPARFVQARGAGRTPTEGRGRTLEYNLAAGTIRMLTDAFLSDGTNEISGSQITYDVGREVVTAGSTDGGDVRMRITPRQEPAPPPDAPAGGAGSPAP